LQAVDAASGAAIGTAGGSAKPNPADGFAVGLSDAISRGDPSINEHHIRRPVRPNSGHARLASLCPEERRPSRCTWCVLKPLHRQHLADLESRRPNNRRTAVSRDHLASREEHHCRKHDLSLLISDDP
jgi:hypothetical protein